MQAALIFRATADYFRIIFIDGLFPLVMDTYKVWLLCMFFDLVIFFVAFWLIKVMFGKDIPKGDNLNAAEKRTLLAWGLLLMSFHMPLVYLLTSKVSDVSAYLILMGDLRFGWVYWIFGLLISTGYVFPMLIGYSSILTAVFYVIAMVFGDFAIKLLAYILGIGGFIFSLILWPTNLPGSTESS